MKKVLFAFVSSLAFILAVLFFIFISMVDTSPMSKPEFLKTVARLKAYRYTGLVHMSDEDLKTLYKWTCTQCHSTQPIESVRHTSKEWRLIIERMRVKNGAAINEREVDAIAAYLQKNFGSNVPTILSPRANIYLKQFLWKSDFGDSDLYVDVIYTPVDYFKVMGGELDMARFRPDKNLLFTVYFNTHQGRLESYPLKDMAVLKVSGGEVLKPVDWTVVYQTGDMHHVEGVLSFQKIDVRKGFMELVLKDLPGQKERLFRWGLPVPEFGEIKEGTERRGR